MLFKSDKKNNRLLYCDYRLFFKSYNVKLTAVDYYLAI
jgi:hypothetical protein